MQIGFFELPADWQELETAIGILLFGSYPSAIYFE